MNKYEIDEKAKELADTYSAYKLARMYLEQKQSNEEPRCYPQYPEA